MAIRDRQKYDEDLFKHSTMTFGEHLEELRTCLFKALIGLTLGFLFGLAIGKPVVLGLQKPLKDALETYYERQSFDKWAADQESKGLVVDSATKKSKQIPGIDQQEHLVFDTAYFAPQKIFGELADAFPQQLGQVSLPSNPTDHPLSRVGPHTIKTADLLKPKALAERLTEAGSGGNTPVKRVWDRLSGAAKADVQRLLLLDGMTVDDRQPLLNRTAAALDSLLEKSDLFDATDFADQGMRPEARELRHQNLLSAEQQRRLNRLLVEATFPGDIAATYPSLLPMQLWRAVNDDPRTKIQSLSVAEVFGFWVKAALVVGAVLASPYIFFQIWAFVAAGLYPHEKKYVHIYLPFSIGLFIAGAALAFIFVFAPVLNFLFEFNSWLGIDPDPRISEWMGFVLLLPVGFGASFQLPLVMLFLERIGVFSVKIYIEKWRIAVLSIFVISMILTPADPVSMMLMAIPLTFLYFGAIGLCKWMPRGHNPFDEA